MKDRKKIVFFISFVSLSLLYVVIYQLSDGGQVLGNEEEYLSRYLLPQTSQEVAPDSEESPSISNDVPSKSHSTESIHSLNRTLGFQTQNNKSTSRVSDIGPEQKIMNRNVFVEMRDIKQSTKNIFFIESRCATIKMAVHFNDSRGFVLNARQCCAIESTAWMNPDHNVYIFHSCLLDNRFFQHSPKFVEKLFKLPNIYVVRLNTTVMFKDCPLEELDKSKLLESSAYPVEHTSDLIRLTLLWRFGGTYSDLDVITIRSLDALKTNWAGMQDEVTIANGVINFEPEGVGHQMLQRALEYANKHYNPLDWSMNGPLLITPIILRECKVKQVIEAQKNCSGNFTVLENPILYPIYYTAAGDFFNRKLGKKIVSLVKKESYSVHIWNKMSHELTVTVGSTQAYGLLADEYCPQVYRNCGPIF